ncbi:hypothetical protein [Microvirga sp. M2]|uniref:hypothetical protein n=1 Tax=Microvirga sp. M2 TaxID=3073270 RepID=UPI0039C30171
MAKATNAVRMGRHGATRLGTRRALSNGIVRRAANVLDFGDDKAEIERVMSAIRTISAFRAGRLKTGA